MKSLSLVSIILFTLMSCNKSNEVRSKISENKSNLSVDLVDTTKSYKAYSFPKNDKGVVYVMSDPSAAPLIPEHSISLDNDEWANNLDDLVGRIIKITSKDSTGNVTGFEIKNNISHDTVNVKLEIPKSAPKQEELLDESKGGQLSFLGFGIEIKNNEKYTYSNLMTVFSRIKDKQIDKNKIPTSFKCDDCGFSYINSASVRVIETTKYTERGRSISAKDLSDVGIAKAIDGKIYKSNVNNDYKKYNRVFITTLSLPQ